MKTKLIAAALLGAPVMASAATTRAEIMEFHAIGKPCCSPFTGTDPER